MKTTYACILMAVELALMSASPVFAQAVTNPKAIEFQHEDGADGTCGYSCTDTYRITLTGASGAVAATVDIPRAVATPVAGQPGTYHVDIAALVATLQVTGRATFGATVMAINASGQSEVSPSADPFIVLGRPRPTAKPVLR